MNIEIKRLTLTAILPEYRYGEPWINLCASLGTFHNYGAIIKGRGDLLIPTGIVINLNDNNIMGKIYISPYFTKHTGITLYGGTLLHGPNNRDEIYIHLFNHNFTKRYIENNTIIARMVIQPVYRPKFKQVMEFT